VKHILSFIFIIFFFSALSAQTAKEIPKESAANPVAFRLGLYGDYSWNFHRTTANVYCCDGGCGVFSNGTGKGFSIGLLGEIPAFGNFDVYASAGYAQRGGSFGDAINNKDTVFDQNSQQYKGLSITNSYVSSIPEIISSLGLKFTPFKKVPFYVRTGVTVNFPLSSSSYTQSEHITTPQGVVYPSTNTTTKTDGSGTIINLKESFGASGAIGMPFPLSERLTASPEVEYYFPLSEVRNDYHWKIRTLQAGVALRYNFYKEVPLPPPPPPPPPTPPVAMAPKPAPVEKPEPPVAYVGLAEPKSISVFETTVTETFPMLPYLFFDSASENLVPRYHQITSAERQSFAEGQLPHNSLGAYYHILNIVGKRLMDKPDGTITLNGTTDGSEVTASNSKALARARAETIKKYLTDVWGISEDRISIKTSVNPTIPSSKRDTAGIAENRRVEIIADDETLLSPVVHAQFKEYAITPESVPFAMSVRIHDPIASWKLSVKAANTQEVYSANGAGEPPSVIGWKLDTKAAEKLAANLKGSEKLRCGLDVTDTHGITGSSNADLPATKETNPFEISRLSLVVFDFDKADINSGNKKMVSEFVAKTIHDGSTVSITGTTDAMGELDHNKELSTTRAFAVHKLIKEENSLAEVTKVEGIGPTYSPEMNSTPEGRYYCRTVTVQVQTPVRGM
jgi:outer membrane protein OmpA-like peptidoglycan-associated protein